MLCVIFRYFFLFCYVEAAERSDVGGAPGVEVADEFAATFLEEDDEEDEEDAKKLGVVVAPEGAPDPMYFADDGNGIGDDKFGVGNITFVEDEDSGTGDDKDNDAPPTPKLLA